MDNLVVFCLKIVDFCVQAIVASGLNYSLRFKINNYWINYTTEKSFTSIWMPFMPL